MNWSVSGDAPLIATPDGGVIGFSGAIYTGEGKATNKVADTPVQSWTGLAYTYPLRRIQSMTTAVATPPYWSFAGANQSSNATSPLCGDSNANLLIAEYGSHPVVEAYFPLPWPRFAPNCFELTKSASSANFKFSDLNKPGPTKNPEFQWALIKYPLIAPASSGYGLDRWVQLIGYVPTLNSGYRDPKQNEGKTWRRTRVVEHSRMAVRR